MTVTSTKLPLSQAFNHATYDAHMPNTAETLKHGKCYGYCFLYSIRPHTQKRSQWLAVLKRIAFVSRSNGSSYPFKQITIHSNGLSYPFKKINIRFNARVIHSKKLASVRMAWAIRSKIFVSCSSGSHCPFKKICQPLQVSVGKNKIVTSSFHWKVKCCK